MQIDKAETFTIPDKCRKVGNPGGKYIVYIEDYAHTFIRQNLQTYKQKMIFFIYGQVFLVDNIYYILVYGATEKKSEQETYFPQDAYLGTMTICTRKKEKVDSKWQIECDFMEELQCTIEDFYIYYEKNERMQNYLISWHEQKEGRGGCDENEIKMKYARAIQEQYHTIKEIGGQKNFYTGICLGFGMIFLVMMTTVLNSYQKMNKLQTDMVQLIDHIEDSNLGIAKAMKPASAVIEPEVIKAEEATLPEPTTVEASDGEETKENEAPEENETEEESEAAEDETAAYSQENEEESNTISEATGVDMASQHIENAPLPDEKSRQTYQSYIVQKGDTLQGILYRQYGSLANMQNICELNQLSNPDDIKEGEELYLP